MVNYYLLEVFLLSKLLFLGFMQFKSNFVCVAKITHKYRVRFSLNKAVPQICCLVFIRFQANSICYGGDYYKCQFEFIITLIRYFAVDRES